MVCGERQCLSFERGQLALRAIPSIERAIVPRRFGCEQPLAAVWILEASGFYSLRYSRSRLVCDRLTGISVAFASLIFRM